MKHVEVLGYTPMAFTPDPVHTVITISGDIEQAINPRTDDLEKASEVFDTQAEYLFLALRDSLPGGTIDRLIGKLLAYKASHFHVNHECHQSPKTKES